MKKQCRTVSFLLSVSVLCMCSFLTSCSGKEKEESGKGTETSVSLPEESTAIEAENEADLALSTVKYTEKDLDTSYNAETDGFILFDSLISASDGVKIENNIVTVEKGGTYLVSGQSDDAQLRIDLEKRESVHLVFSGVSISCRFGVPVYVKNTSKLILTIADGTENELTDQSSAAEISETEGTSESSTNDEGTEDAPDAALYSEEDLTINGTGTLTIRSEQQSGIISKDVIKLIDAEIIVESNGKGIKGKDGIAVRNASIKINSAGDGMKATNSTDSPLGFVLIESGNLQITAENDGIQAEGVLSVSGGTLLLTTGGGSGTGSSTRESPGKTSGEKISQKGLKAGTCMLLTGGTFQINSRDDAIHTNGSCIIKGGEFELQTGDDAIHADKTLTVEDGTIRILQSYEGLEAASIYLKGGKTEISADDDGINAASKTSGSQIFPGAMHSGDFSDDSGSQSGTVIHGADGNNLYDPSVEPVKQWGFPGNQSEADETSGALYISGGYCYINANGDGLDSNGVIRMTGGTVLISGPEDNGNSAIDYDGSFVMEGGLLIAAGSSGMAQQPGSESTVYTMMASFAKQAAGTILCLCGKDGRELLTFAPAKAFDNLVICTLDLKKGESYTLYTGGSSTGQSENGFYSGGEYSGGTALCTVTIENICTVFGSSKGGFDGGSFPGRGDGMGPGGRR